MRKAFCVFLIAMFVVGIGGCKQTVPEFPSAEIGACSQVALEFLSDEKLKMEQDASLTDIAKQLGITLRNYPVVDGSTSTLGIVQEMYKSMFGEGGADTEDYPTEASKTVPSYQLLIDGEADMIIVPYASADILNRAKEKGVTLEFNRIAAEALIFITPLENPVENITTEQIRSIYIDNGIDNWKELGGPDKKLVPICRNEDSGSQSQMDNLILNNEEMHPDIKENYVELTMDGMLSQVAFQHYGGIGGTPTESYAIGYTLYAYLRDHTLVTGIGDSLKILAFDGIQPDQESLANGAYSLTDGYYAVTRSDLPEDHTARTMIEWLRGDGASVVEKLGLIPSK